MSTEKCRLHTASQGIKEHSIENLRPREAALYLGVSESLLAKLRMREKRDFGPRFIKVAGCVIYRRADLEAWLDENAVQCAS